MSANVQPISSTESAIPRSLMITLIVVLVADFMDLIDSTMLSIAAPIIRADLNSSESALQWMIAGYSLALGTMLITGGRFGDQFGRRRAFLIGLTGSTIATIGSAIAPTIEVLILTRVIQGFFTGIMLPQSLAIIRSTFNGEARAKAFAAYGIVLSLAAVAGPLLGGVLTESNLFGLGWRSIFWVNALIGGLTLLVALKVLPESLEEEHSRLDLIGAVLIGGASALLLLPLIQSNTWGWTSASWTSVGLGVMLLVVFLVYESGIVRRGGIPILDPALLRVRSFSSGLLIAVLFFGVIGAYFLLFSLYLQLGTGRGALETGLIILPYAFGSLLTSGVGVALARRFGRMLLIIGTLTMTAAQIIMLLIVQGGTAPSGWLLALPMFIGGLGIGLAAPILVNVVLAGVPARDAGTAAGMLTTISQIGGATGVAIFGLLFFQTVNAAPTGEALLTVYSKAFAATLPWQIAAYVIVVPLLFLLPKHTIDAETVA